MRLTNFQVLDHGCDSAQYFPGCGTAFTSFGYAVTGCGDDFSEAIEDALDTMAHSGDECDGVDFDDLKSRIKANDFGDATGWRKSVSASKAAPDDDEYHYYVSIRYTTVADESQHEVVAPGN